MNEPDPVREKHDRFSEQVGARATRRLRAQRHKPRSVWTGFAFFGLIGWSVVVPTLIGATLGLWLDRHHPGGRSWTLALLVAGLVLGCFNAWRWVAKEQREIKREQENGKHE